MSFSTRVQRSDIEGCTIFTIKVRTHPEYEGGDHDLVVEAATEEEAAIEAILAAYDEDKTADDEAEWPAGEQHPADATTTDYTAPDSEYAGPDAA